MISELRQVPSVSVPETTYLVVSLKNGAPGSSSTVRVDHAGSNISYVVRQQDPLRALGDSADRLSHRRMEAVLERPGRRVDHAVEAHELVHVHLSHRLTSCRCRRVDAGALANSSPRVVACVLRPRIMCQAAKRR